MLNYFGEYILYLFTAGKLTRAPLLNVFSRKLQLENRRGSDSWTGAYNSMWSCMGYLFTKLKTFIDNYWTNSFFLPEGCLHQELEN